MKTLHTEIEINAKPEHVWNILTDFARFPEWNPFIRHIEGETKPGADLTVVLEPPESDRMRFEPTVLNVVPNRELRWQGRQWNIPKLMEGEHIFKIEPIEEDRVRFVQIEIFEGWLVPVIGWFSDILDKTRRGFEAMNEALKKRAERPGTFAARVA
jgi:hypothetical protein